MILSKQSIRIMRNMDDVDLCTYERETHLIYVPLLLSHKIETLKPTLYIDVIGP